MGGEQDSIGIGLSAALNRQFQAEGEEFLHYLGTVLTGCIPERVNQREKGILRKQLVGLDVTLDGGDLRLILQNGALQPTFTRKVRGIALKTETLSMEEWIEILSSEMDTLASRSQKTRTTLADFLKLP